RPLVICLDRLVEAKILPEHRVAYERVLEEIIARVQKVCDRQKIIVRRGKEGISVRRGPDAVPHLSVTTGGSRWSGMGITISNQMIEPYSVVRYSRNAFRGRGVHLISDEPTAFAP